MAAPAPPAGYDWREHGSIPWNADQAWADRYREVRRREAEAREALRRIVEERESKERSIVRTHSFKEDLIAATWHPDRILTWCLTPEEAADMTAPWTGAP